MFEVWVNWALLFHWEYELKQILRLKYLPFREAKSFNWGQIRWHVPWQVHKSRERERSLGIIPSIIAYYPFILKVHGRGMWQPKRTPRLAAKSQRVNISVFLAHTASRMNCRQFVDEWMRLCSNKISFFDTEICISYDFYMSQNIILFFLIFIFLF